MKKEFMFRRALALMLVLFLLLPVWAAADGNEELPADGEDLTWFQPIRVQASSYIRGKDPLGWAPDKMMDGSADTCWQFSTKTTALGDAYAYFEFSQPVDLTQFWIKNGFWRTDNGYQINTRVQEMQLSYLLEGKSTYGSTETLYLRDDSRLRGWQQFAVYPGGRVKAVRLRVMSVYRGTKYANDVCISELLFVGPRTSSSQLPVSAWPTGVKRPTSDLYALAIDKLATRDGPGTEYDELGTYRVKGEWIQILARCYDVNNVCWVQCVIPYRNKDVIAWTGWKRFDHSSLDINMVPLMYLEDFELNWHDYMEPTQTEEPYQIYVPPYDEEEYYGEMD